MARYRAEEEAAFGPRSRRPKTSPNATPDQVVDLIVGLRKELHGAGGLDAGSDTIGWHLAHHHRPWVSRVTISRHLAACGLITPEPKKKPNSSYIRFAADQPNETWQSDFAVRATEGKPGRACRSIREVSGAAVTDTAVMASTGECHPGREDDQREAAGIQQGEEHEDPQPRQPRPQVHG